MSHEIKTPETHPDHEVVGKRFRAWDTRGLESATYYCDSYDPRIGYWMTNEADPTDRKNVSERAINRTFHFIYSDPERGVEYTGKGYTAPIAAKA
jgi:hypothetical protein